MSKQNLLEELIHQQPKLHCLTDGNRAFEAGVYNWAIGNDVLKWFFDKMDSSWRTLETGCGYSTIVFAISETEHTTISPFREEHDTIKNWCSERNINCTQCNFIEAKSENVIYKLPDLPLDMVLIDGDHAFPIPFIDWYYTADLIKKDGYVVVDDTQIITGRILSDFLSKEKGRWELAHEFGKTSVFRKVAEKSVLKGIYWELQPYCEKLLNKKDKTYVQRIFHKLAYPIKSIFKNS